MLAHIHILSAHLQQLLGACGEVVALVLEEADGDVEVGERPVVLPLHLRQADPRVRHVVLHRLRRDDAVQLVVNLVVVGMVRKLEGADGRFEILFQYPAYR